MDGIQDKIANQFGHRLRTRVSGICIEDNRILLVKHRGLGPQGILCLPPGGGMEYGTSAEENLVREFKEETGLDILVEKFMFVHEFLAKPLHALELFFRVKRIRGALARGFDPEMPDNDQIIQEVKFFTEEEIRTQPRSIFHNMLSVCGNLPKLQEQKGYFIFDPNH